MTMSLAWKIGLTIYFMVGDAIDVTYIGVQRQPLTKGVFAARLLVTMCLVLLIWWKA